jgi:predicted permease
VLGGGARRTAVSTDGRPLQQDNTNALGVRANVVSDRYFETMNIPFVRGRSFASADRPGTPRVAIVSQSFVERVWPGEDPIGKTVWDEINRPQSIVGVVPDTVYTSTIDRDTSPTFYQPLAQNYESGVALHVRAAGDPRSLVPAIREAVRQVDSQIVVERPQLLRHVLDGSLSKERMMAALIGIFAGLALLLAVVGLYGVMAHAATQRTAEIGIRIAMGAQPGSILALIMGQGLRLLAIGSALGLLGALMSTRLIAAQLFAVTPSDPLTFAVVCAVLAVAGLLACAIPARRAARVDPITALRRG